MENFFYKQEFYSDMDNLVDYVEDNEDCKIEELPDTWEIKVEETTLEPMFQLKIDRLMDLVPEDRMSEDGDELDTVRRVFTERIDFEAINSRLPKFYYPNGKMSTITKADLLEYIS